MARTSRLNRIALALGPLPLLMFVLLGPAVAVPVKYQFGGVISEASASAGVAAGTPFSGTFSYDPAKLTGGYVIEGFSQASYGLSRDWPGSVADGAGLTLQIGGKTILANPGGLAIATSEIDYPGQFGYRDAAGNPASPHTSVVISNSNVDDGPLQVALTLNNPARGLSDSLYPLNLAEFPDAQLSVTSSTDPGAAMLYAGTIDSLVQIPVPEPACASLLCFVAVGWFARRRRHRAL